MILKDEGAARAAAAALWIWIAVIATGCTPNPPATEAHRSRQLTAIGTQQIRLFRVRVPDRELVERRRRVTATRWPDRETVADDPRACGWRPSRNSSATGEPTTTGAKPRRNSTPSRKFVTTIDGLDIHFLHVRSRHPNPMPLIMTHGWPGSMFELIKVIAPLTDLTAYGGRAQDAFDVVMLRCPASASRAARRAPGAARTTSPAPGRNSRSGWAISATYRKAATGAR